MSVWLHLIVISQKFLFRISEKLSTCRFLDVLFRKCGLKNYVYFTVGVKYNLNINKYKYSDTFC